MAPITIAGREGDVTGSIIMEVRGTGPQEVTDAIEEAAARVAVASSSSEISASISAPAVSYRDAAGMEKQGFEAMKWEPTSRSVVQGIRGSIRGSVRRGVNGWAGRRNGWAARAAQSEAHAALHHCLQGQGERPRQTAQVGADLLRAPIHPGAHQGWAARAKLLRSAPQWGSGQLCSQKSYAPSGAVVAYAYRNRASIEPIVAASPDLQQEVLDRWKESGRSFQMQNLLQGWYGC